MDGLAVLLYRSIAAADAYRCRTGLSTVLIIVLGYAEVDQNGISFIVYQNIRRLDVQMHRFALMKVR